MPLFALMYCCGDEELPRVQTIIKGRTDAEVYLRVESSKCPNLKHTLYELVPVSSSDTKEVA